MTVEAASEAAIASGASILRAGGLVAFPTETVYGLGADATMGDAVARIYEVKGRPSFNPLIVHVGDKTWVAGLAQPDPRFDRLADAFWPGPLSLVLHRRSDCPVSALVSAGLDTIAVRSPDHPLAQALLRAVTRPLAAPSANLSGSVSPTCARHVVQSLGDQIDLVIDGGPCRVGLESTVLDLTAQVPTILRPGLITQDQIAALIGAVTSGADDAVAPKSPGQQAMHYAPSLPLRMDAMESCGDEALLGFGPAPGATLNLSMRGDLREAAANFFAMLRSLDDPKRFSGIAVAPIPAEGIGAAINDRLRRAASRA